MAVHLVVEPVVYAPAGLDDAELRFALVALT
jgi:hypothetical protein